MAFLIMWTDNLDKLWLAKFNICPVVINFKLLNESERNNYIYINRKMNNRRFISQGKDVLIQVMLLVMVTQLSGVQFDLKSYAWFQNWTRAGVGCAVLVFLFHWLAKRCDLEQKMVRFGNKSHCWESIRLHGSPVISRLHVFKLHQIAFEPAWEP